MLKTPGTCLLLALVSGCAATPAGDGTVRNTELHALMSSRIDVQLAQIDALLLEQQRTELELNEERRRHTGRIAESARVLQDAVTNMLALQAQLGLDPQQAAVFTTLAAELKRHGAELEALASAGRVDALPAAMALTRSTCAACHQLYRDN